MNKKLFCKDRGSVALIIIAILAVLLGVAYYFIQVKESGDVETPLPSVSTPIPTSGQAYVEMVNSEAVATTTIDITRCRPNPAMASFVMNSSVTFINNDSKQHDITLDSKHSFVVPAKGKFVEKFDFWEFPGVRKYNCDNELRAGIVNVIKK